MTRIHALTLLLAGYGLVQAGQAPVGYDDTPMQPNGKWRIHDGNRPQPAVVTPGGDEGPATPLPSDATVLLGRGNDLSAWQMSDGAAPTWPMAGGVLSTGTNPLRTKAE